MYAYWYGTFGQKCSTALYNSKKKQYPEHYTAGRAAGYKADISAGKRCLDCIGLLKAAAWTECGAHEPKYETNGCPDKSADGMLAWCKAQGMKNGKIATLPDVPGLLLHKSGHAGRDHRRRPGPSRRKATPTTSGGRRFPTGAGRSGRSCLSSSMWTARRGKPSGRWATGCRWRRA